jgi:Protein of unknown function (DUF3047)
VKPAAHRAAHRLLAIGAVILTLGAGPGSTVRVDNWDAYIVGPLDLSAEWRRYPPERVTLKHAPEVVVEAGRPVLQLTTVGEAVRIGRALKIDLAKTPWLIWDWKPLVLPEGGDVRDLKRNDQAARVMVAFEGMKGILYVWDTTAPVGTEVRPDELELFQRVLIVVRSGSGELGHWLSERRNVVEDFRRLFGGEPPPIKLVGVESHSNDTRTRTSMRFGRLRFDAR